MAPQPKRKGVPRKGPENNPNITCPRCPGTIALRNAGDLNAHNNAVHDVYAPNDPKARTTERAHINRKSVDCLIIALVKNRKLANIVKEAIGALEEELRARVVGSIATGICNTHKTTDTHSLYCVDPEKLREFSKQQLRDLLVEVRLELWGDGSTLRADMKRVDKVLDEDQKRFWEEG